MSKGSLRNEMPQTAAWIDKMREVFGADVVDDALRRGLRGGQGFHAVEGGREVGTPILRGVRIGRDARGNSVNLDDPLDGGEPMRGGGDVAWQAALNYQSKE